MSNNSELDILVVEDDPNLGTLLKEYLTAKGYNCDLRVNGEEGFEAFTKKDYDFLILDIMMPLKDGFELAEEIRNVNQEIPILFLTAKSMKEDTLKGFKIGADDYMTKPFSMEELLARIQAILKRVGGSNNTEEKGIYCFGQSKLNYDKQRLYVLGEERKLTTKENELMRLLYTTPGILERNFALKAVWGDDNYFNGRSMDVYIAKLRKHLKLDESVEILNVHGKGFKLVTQ